jgi:hypothetical protein
MTTKPRLMTADELLKLPDDHQRHELVRGESRTSEVVPGWRVALAELFHGDEAA